MTKFTRGPWKVVKRRGKNSRWIMSKDEWLLAAVHYRQNIGTEGFLPSEAKANARLIAAAPDMFEALTFLVASAEAGIQVQIDDYNAAKAALELAGDSDSDD